MSKASALAQVEQSVKWGVWTSKAEVDALNAASTWTDFMTALKINPLWISNSNALVALKAVFLA